MSKKISCGGFYLSDTLGVDENGKLGVNGGEPYKSLVTDGTGSVKWKDRLAYDDSRLVVDLGGGVRFAKVANEVPSWASVDSPIKYWVNNGYNGTGNPKSYIDLSNGSFMLEGGIAAFITTDNVEFNGHMFPEKGVYFSLADGLYATGISSADSDTPELTWDGNIGIIKKIDEKFLPECPVFTVQTKGVNKYLHDAKGERMTLEQAKSIGLNFVIQSEYGEGSIIKPISVAYDSVNARFYAVKLENAFGDGISIKFNNYYAGEDVQSEESEA